MRKTTMYMGYKKDRILPDIKEDEDPGKVRKIKMKNTWLYYVHGRRR